MQPTASDVHVNVPLSNISVAWMQDQSIFVSPQVFGEVLVQHQSNLYWVFDKFNWFKAKAEKRAPGTESVGDGWTLSQASYVCDVYAIHKDIADQIRDNADSQLQLDTSATEFVSRDLALTKEITWAARYFTTGVWLADFTPGTLWSAGGSTPIADIRAQMLILKRRTSFKPTHFTITPEVWDVLVDHPDFTSRVSGGATTSQPTLVMPELLAAILGLEKVLIAEGVQNEAIEGAAEDMQFIFGKDCLLTYSPSRPGLMTPSAGYTFVWNRPLTGGGTRVKRFRLETLESDRIEAQANWDQKIVSSEMGIFFDGVIA